MASPSRTFVDSPAVRGNIPLLIGLSGPSGSGKTFSALRLATGIQRVTGGDIFGLDSEADRMRALADYFRFRHVPFVEPFGPLDYLAGIEHCVKRGAGVVIVDSMSHEHEGPGGVLEQHDAECDRLMTAWKTASRESVQLTAWAKPKAARRRLLNSLLQMKCCFIFCFRAKDKILPVKGGKPEKLGWVPIAGAEFLYEQTINFLLPQMSDGTPTWLRDSDVQGLHLKPPPKQFVELFRESRQLDEDTGEAMAKWAAGGAAPPAATVPSPRPASRAGSAVPAAPPAAAGPKASPDTLAALSQQLSANGEATKAAQTLWVRKALGKGIEDLTEEEATKLLSRAEDEAAA